MKNTVLVIVTLALIFGNSCQDNTAVAELEKLTAQSELEEQNKKIAERFHNDLAIDRNWDAADEILSPDVIIHGQGGADVNGIEGVKGFDELYKNLNNGKINHYEIIAEGDYVFIRWDLSFDHTSELMGIPASGNHVSGIFGMDLFLIKEGRIAEMWQNWDQLGFMQQMGAIPAP